MIDDCRSAREFADLYGDIEFADRYDDRPENDDEEAPEPSAGGYRA